MPAMTNETGKMLKEFNKNYISLLQQRYGTAEANEDQIKAHIQELQEIEQAKLSGR